MKTMTTILISLTALCAAVRLSGFALDGVTLFTIGAAAVFAGMFAGDYSRVPTYNLAPAKAPARQKKARASDVGVEFATMATYHSMM